jgi:hypothetical protein
MQQTIKKETLPGEEKSLVQNIAQETAVGQYDIDGFLEKRKEFIQKVNAIMVKGSDYYEIQGRKSLAKGGAEKIASIFGWQAEFRQDDEVVKMIDQAGLVAFICNLTKKLEFVGQGRGAADFNKNAKDANKTIKMAQKSAFIDAVLRSSGLSDFFTQDLEDMPEHEIGNVNQSKVSTPQASVINPSPKQIEMIQSLCKQKGYTKEDIYNWGFSKLTGGRDGTASELIDVLMKFKPKEQADYLTEMANEQKAKEKAEMEAIGNSVN